MKRLKTTKLPLALLAILTLFLPLTASAAPLSFYCTVFRLFCPAAPGFVPTYERDVTVSDVSGQSLPYTLNPFYFATADTANTVCLKLACTFVIARPCDIGGGPAVCSAIERFVVFRDGLMLNAGQFAAFWTNNPEDKFPGKAQRAAQDQLAAERARAGLPALLRPRRRP